MLCLSTAGYAQSHQNPMSVIVELKDLKDTTVSETQTHPEFPGGYAALDEYLRQNVHYPEAAAQAKVSGTVLVSYLIDSVGNVTNVKVRKGLGHGCDEEALRVVQKMPRWKPGTQMGKAIPVSYGLPIRFPVK